MKLNQKLLPVADAAFKFLNVEEGVFEGWASKYGGIDSYGDTIMPGAYAKSLATGRPVSMYYNHISRRADMPARIGTWTFEERDEGLWAKGQLLLSHPLVKNLTPSMSAGMLDGLSIGFYIPEGGAKVTPNGVRQLLEIDLREVSIVDDPADDAARISLDSIKSLHTERDLENFLRDAGLSKSEALAAVAAAREILAKTEASNLPENQAKTAEDEIVEALAKLY